MSWGPLDNICNGRYGIVGPIIGIGEKSGAPFLAVEFLGKIFLNDAHFRGRGFAFVNSEERIILSDLLGNSYVLLMIVL